MFTDRYDAGRQLAAYLQEYKNEDAVVYGLPRGGVLVGLEIAKKINAQLDIVLTRKLGHPFNPDLALCAITEDGQRIYGESGLCGIGLDWIESESAIQQREIQRRRNVYKDQALDIRAAGKVAILVDDGIATGLTMKAAILAIKKQSPQKIVVAVPVAPRQVVLELEQLVDEVVVLDDAFPYRGSVGAYYAFFPKVYDKEVVVSIKEAARHFKNHQFKRVLVAA